MINLPESLGILRGPPVYDCCQRDREPGVSRRLLRSNTAKEGGTMVWHAAHHLLRDGKQLFAPLDCLQDKTN